MASINITQLIDNNPNTKLSSGEYENKLVNKIK